MFKKNDLFYKQFFALMLPMAFQGVISFCVQVLDNVMVGYLGDSAVSAVTLANQPYFIFSAVVFGFASGGAVLISQYWGKKDIATIKNIITIVMWLVIIVASLYSLVCLFLAEPIMRIFSQDPEIVATGVSYLRIISFSYLLNGISNCYLSSLKAVENVKPSTVILCSSFVINLFFNYILMYGVWGLPRLGVNGAAIGTIIARFFEVAACVVYSVFMEKKIGYTLKDLLYINKKLWPDFVRISVPVIGNDLIWSLASSAQTAIVSNISTTFVTAVSIASTFQQIGMLFVYGTASSISIMIGKSIGEGKVDATQKMAIRFLKLSAGIGVMVCLLMMLFRYPMLLLYPNISAESLALAKEIMLMLSVLMIPLSVENACTIGILRGAGDTTFSLLVDGCCMWLIGIPMGWLAAYVWKLPVIAVYFFLRCDTLVKNAVCFIRIKKGRFIHNVTRDFETEKEGEEIA